MLKQIQSFFDRAFHTAFWVRELNPLASEGDEIRVRVREIQSETPDFKTFVLTRNRYTGKFRAGQFITVGVEVNGRLIRRCYSLVTAPGSEEMAFMVRRVPDGRVSTWLHDHVSVGEVLRISPPTGNFVLPTPAPNKILLLSGGSGITPVMSILRDLVDRDAVQDVVLVHASRTPEDIPFRAEFDYLTGSEPHLRITFLVESEEGRPTVDRIREIVPDVQERLTLMCGPSGMMETLAPLWQDMPDKLLVERFTSTVRERQDGQTVNLTLKNRTLTVPRGVPLLTSLEAVGIQHPSGCRMGICNTCMCGKAAGQTVNLTTEMESVEPEPIRLCVTAPLTNLTLDI